MIVKKNQLFESVASGNTIRVIERPSFGRVTVANVDSRNRSDKTTARTVQVDSIRRRYNPA